ncbi:MAG: hypothetical protein J6T74_00825 [Clostridia bacterium]|nr:hypothetical protein [Clostridia bacterium]
MKKSLKRTCAVVMAVAATAGLTGVQKLESANVQNNKLASFSAYADPAPTGVMTISSYKKSVVYGDTVTLPTAKFDGADIGVDGIKVTSPTGANVTITDGKFKVEAVGTYRIRYTSGNYVGEITIVSTIPNYSLSYEKNSSRILPTKVSVDYTGDIYVPNYVITDKNGDKVDSSKFNVDISVTKGSNVFTVGADGKINFGTTGLEVGTYYVTYTVTTAQDDENNIEAGSYITSDTVTFKCVDADNAFKADSKLKLSYSKEKISSVNLGKMVELPEISATLEGESVDVYYTVEVYKNGLTKIEDASIISKNADTGIWEFTAKEIADYYTVKYAVNDAIGNTEEIEFAITTVEDTLDPTPWVVDPYDKTDAEAIKALKNVDYKLASYFQSGDNSHIRILPIYAEDLGTFGFGEYKLLQRQVKSYSSGEVLYTDTEDPNKTLVFNCTDEENTLAATEKLAKDKDGNAIKLKKGKYVVSYTVKDAAGNENTSTFDFEVRTDYTDGKFDGEYVDPTVKFNDEWYETVDKGEVIEFSEPTFSDEYDQRLLKSVSYQYFTNADVAIGEKEELELGSNKKYSIDTAKAPVNAYKVKIFASATNDSGRTTTETNEIIVKSETTGTVAPEVVEVEADTNPAILTQGVEILVPTIKFSDDLIDTLDVDITITCTDGEDVTDYEANNLVVTRAGGYLFCGGAKFVAATKGNYVVAVKATDAAGNMAIKFIEYDVVANDYAGELRFANVGITDKTIELGESYKLPTAKIVGDNAADYSYEVQLVSGPTGYKLNNDKFTPSKVGEYKLRYVMYLTANAKGALDGIVEDEVVEFTITVEDTTAPEIHVDWKSNNILKTGETTPTSGLISAVYENYTKILLPMFSATDLSKLDENQSMITITCSKTSSTRTIKFADMAKEFAEGTDGTMYYNFNRDAEYTITYTAVDVQGNSAKKVFTIKVGDLEPPVLVVDDSILESEYKIGNTIDIDLNSDSGEIFKIYDGDESAIVKNIKIKLTCNGSEVKNDETGAGKYSFKLETAGSYELTFYVSDDAENKSNEVVKTFEIAEEGEETVDTTKVVGTILIVVSVLVLGGVVVYFIVSKKKMDKLYNS